MKSIVVRVADYNNPVGQLGDRDPYELFLLHPGLPNVTVRNPAPTGAGSPLRRISRHAHYRIRNGLVLQIPLTLPR